MQKNIFKELIRTCQGSVNDQQGGSDADVNAVFSKAIVAFILL